MSSFLWPDGRAELRSPLLCDGIMLPQCVLLMVNTIAGLIATHEFVPYEDVPDELRPRGFCLTNVFHRQQFAELFPPIGPRGSGVERKREGV